MQECCFREQRAVADVKIPNQSCILCDNFVKFQNDQFPQLANFAFQYRNAGLVKFLFLLINFYFAFTHKPIVQAHIVWTTQADKNRQNRTFHDGVGGRTTDTFLTLLFANP